MIYGYTRESVDPDRCSQLQVEQIKNYLLRSQDTMTDIFNDDEPYGSLPFLERPMADDLVTRTAKTGDTIVAYKLENCFISIENAMDTINELLERKIYFNFVELGVDVATEYGQSVMETVTTFMDFNREIRRQRVRNNLRKKRLEKGPCNNQSPMGYKIVRNEGKAYFVPDHKEREQIGKIIQWRNDGHTWSEILRRNKPKHRANGNKWNQSNIRVAYQAGLDDFPGFEDQKNAWDIIDEEKRQAMIKRKMSERNRREPKE